jgi:hypothetical protein
MASEYPDIMKQVQDDEYYVEAAFMYKEEMPHEEISNVRLRRIIKKVDRDKLADELKRSYRVNRVNFRYIEK